MAKKFKRFISLIALPILAMAFIFAGCAEYIPPTGDNNDPSTPSQPGGSTKPSNPGDSNNPSDPEEPNNPGGSDNPGVVPAGTFTIQLLLVNKNAVESVFNSKVSKDVVKMTAQWTDTETGAVHRSQFNEDGLAVNSSLDGDYNITILNIPNGYTYDANSYTADNDFCEVTVRLYELGNLGTLRRYDKDHSYYVLNSTGVYRTELKSASDRVLFQYRPSTQGEYSFLTLVDVTANEINPFVDVYYGSSQYINFGYPAGTTDGGGVENTYTKNVYLKYTLAADEVGNVFWFELYSTCRNTDAYPLTVDFMFERDGDFQRRYPESKPVEVTEDFSKTPETPEGTFFYCATRGGEYRVLDQSMVRLNPEDGYYYYYDGVTGEFKERLYAKISAKNEVADEGFNGSNVIRMLNYVVGYDELNPLNYVEFIQTYAKYCNVDGCYPVNEELKTFLQNFAVAQRYFNDGNGVAETPAPGFAGYNADEESQWMYACGFYSKG